MAGLQRTAVSFRRQGSSGIVWDDRFLSELTQVKPEQQEDGETKQEEQGQLQQDNNPEKVDVKPTRNVAPINMIERSRSNGEKQGYCTSKVSSDMEPPSPKVLACSFCSTAFGKQAKNHRAKPGKRRSR